MSEPRIQRRRKSRACHGAAHQPVIERLEDRYLLSGGSALAAPMVAPLSPAVPPTAPQSKITLPMADQPHSNGSPALPASDVPGQFAMRSRPEAPVGDSGGVDFSRTNARDLLFVHWNSSPSTDDHGVLMDYPGLARLNPDPWFSHNMTVLLRLFLDPDIVLTTVTMPLIPQRGHGIDVPVSADLAAEQSAIEAFIAVQTNESGISQVVPALNAEWIAAISSAASHLQVVSQTLSQGFENAGSQVLALVARTGGMAAISSPLALPVTGSDLAGIMSGESGGNALVQEEKALAPQARDQRVSGIQALPSPQGASLLTAGMTLDIARLERAIQALVAPMVEEGSKDLFYWLGLSSWLVAAALACEAARRRLGQRPPPSPTLLTARPEHAAEERA